MLNQLGSSVFRLMLMWAVVYLEFAERTYYELGDLSRELIKSIGRLPLMILKSSFTAMLVYGDVRFGRVHASYLASATEESPPGKVRPHRS